ncbi:MAG: hypothetical protein U5L45_18740 [Saprospiraceae bacterium]|nr:hypothetical protein [Saprospiraceae bacterium]
MKKILQLATICLVFAACSPLFHVKKQLLTCPKTVIPLVSADSLEHVFSRNKLFHPKIKNAALVALSRYPELKNTRIEFLFRNITATMETRPKINLKAFSKKQRTYQVFINFNKGKNRALDIDSLTETMKIGWIAHELGHVVDYESRSAFSLMVMGLFYVSVPSFKRNIEQSVDIITIRHGLGYENCEGAEYLLYQSNAAEKYRKNNLSYYLPIDTMNVEICKCR